MRNIEIESHMGSWARACVVVSAMYYRDEFDLPPSRYSRDSYYSSRDRYDDRPPLRGGGFSLLDDPPPPHYRDLASPPRLGKEARGFGTDLEPSGYAQGSVFLVPNRPKPTTREKPPRCNTVFVGSLPEGTTEKHLYDAFCEFGPIQDVRIARTRGFGHVEFKNESSVDKAVLFNGYTLRIGPKRDDVAEIHVDFAQSREASDAKRRMKSGEVLVFNAPNAHTISADLRNEDTFEFSAKNLISWFEKGNCSSATANTFFGLLSSVNTHCHKLGKDVKSKEEECQAQIAKYKENLEGLLKDCDIIDEVFEKATFKKSWDQFTKPQRKTIGQWKEAAQDLRKELNCKITESVESNLPLKGSFDGSDSGDDKEPPKKKIKTESDTNLEASLSRTMREMDQLKMDHEVAIEKREKQILQLKTVLARFKQNCPEEWDNIINGKGDKEQTDDDSSSPNKESKSFKEEQFNGNQEDGEGEWEVIDGINMDDLNKALDSGSLVGGSSLAQAAAAYAQLRTQLGSTKDETGSSLSETDIALTAVLAAFVAVHPLGATLAQIQSYFMTLNSTYNSYYLESLLRRLPKVFQYAPASAGGECRWWFLGFQTVSVNSQEYQQLTQHMPQGGEVEDDQEMAEN